MIIKVEDLEMQEGQQLWRKEVKDLEHDLILIILSTIVR